MMSSVGKRPGPVEIIWQQGAEAFAFLAEDFDFDGPERTDHGIAFHRPDLHVDITLWAWKHEAGFDTTVRRVDPVTGRQQVAELDRLYVECGLGPPQDVPNNVGGGHTISKRVHQHAHALRLLMPHLIEPTATDLFHRCRSDP